jgi:gluconolactonase
MTLTTWRAAATIAVSALALSPLAARQRGAAPPQGVRDVTVTAIPGVIAAGATWAVAWQGTDNADGIVGTDDGGLLFAQEQPNQISRLDRNDRASVFLRDTHGTGALSVDAGGRIFAVERTCTDPGRGAAAGACNEPTVVGILAPERKTLADNFEGKPLGRLNDLVVDRKGGAYFTVGGAFYASATGRVTSLGDNIRANGIILSRDDRVLFVTNGNTVLAFDVQPDGSAVNRRDFAKLEAGGAGDGLAIDAAGRLYVTSAPGVQVFDEGGSYLGLIPTPRSVISVAFSGADKKTLYVVGSGALGPDGREFVTAEGVRNNAKTIYRISMLAQGFKGRAK